MKSSLCTDSASHKKGLIPKGTVPKSKERMLSYKRFAIAFSYPEGDFFNFFPELNLKKEELCLEYDRIFRSSEVWLYGSEYIAENEFQRAKGLADINGFYRAFGVEPDRVRPDSLTCELEFMHYLIFKEMNAKNQERAFVCQDAQKKFFLEHLFPLVKNVAEKIISVAPNRFYLDISKKMIKFLDEEEEFFRNLD